LNAGDYLLGLGYRIITGLPVVDAAAQRDLVAILADAHVRLARGQGAELWWRDAADKRLSPAEALASYGLKTSPAFEAAVAMGVRLAGLPPGEAAAIDRYALHVGTGFQVLNDLKDWSGDLENDRRAAGDLLGGRPTLMWALALERLGPADAERLLELADSARRGTAGDGAAASVIAAARRLYDAADVPGRAAAIVAEQRSLAAAAVATCRLRRLREVLEFLLDLAVPEQAATHLVS
jgi:geranylgeranyl pyrophosphate synthase